MGAYTRYAHRVRHFDQHTAKCCQARSCLLGSSQCGSYTRATGVVKNHRHPAKNDKPYVATPSVAGVRDTHVRKNYMRFPLTLTFQKRLTHGMEEQCIEFTEHACGASAAVLLRAEQLSHC